MAASSFSPQRAAVLKENIGMVLANVRAATSESRKTPVRLVAVSKLKPASDVLALHTTTNQEHFGENYVQELLEKATILPRSIKWHFIGGLQSNKCQLLAQSVPNLWCVESVDSIKKADRLNAGRQLCLAKIDADKVGTVSDTHDWSSLPWFEPQLRVLVQVNTSGEEGKSGSTPGTETVTLCKHILHNCPHLRLHGLMTIGAIGRSLAAAEGQENDDFLTLVTTRDQILTEIGKDDIDSLQLSMGMSSDYEVAIRMGSDQVRVGTTIFGDRPPKGAAII